MDVTQPADFFQSVLNSMSQQMALVDDSGQIQWVNQAWKDFSTENDGREEKTWRDVNYFDVCARSTNFGDLDAVEVLAGIRRVLSADETEFFFEYPCHSPSEQRWFMMRFHPLKNSDDSWFVFTHQNITERKLMELQVLELSTLDSLTGISNRRRFDQFIESEWLQNRRLNSPISLALVDVDFFKQYNDNYGHLAGDECLRSVCKVLSGHARRPGDLVARYGGDEFAVILGNTDEEAAWLIADDILADMPALNIGHEFSTCADRVTISIGVATFWPTENSEGSFDDLIAAADASLFEAKDLGRNRVFSRSAPKPGQIVKFGT